jgi:hypothetical protein
MCFYVLHDYICGHYEWGDCQRDCNKPSCEKRLKISVESIKQSTRKCPNCNTFAILEDTSRRINQQIRRLEEKREETRAALAEPNLSRAQVKELHVQEQEREVRRRACQDFISQVSVTYPLLLDEMGRFRRAGGTDEERALDNLAVVKFKAEEMMAQRQDW